MAVTGTTTLDFIEMFTVSESPAGEANISINTAAASSVGTANSEGSASSLAKSDHGHDARHAMLDGSLHSDSVADAVTRGSLVYGNSTPSWDELVIGAAGHYLRSDGTDIAWGDLEDHVGVL